jgi:arylsulfatase A-like enzyme
MKASQRPNVLLINVDDLGWTDLGFMGSTYYETPQLDAFAGEGCIFPNAYAAAPNCAPSRACMLTGRYPGVHGVYTVGNPDRGEEKTRKLIPHPNRDHISEDLPTLAHALGDLGYTCGIIGKWHLSDDPLRHGFHENVAGCHRGSPKSYFAPYENPAIEDGPDGEYLPERLANEASAFIARHKDHPFFLYYPTYLVHTPIQGKDELIRKYTEKLEQGGDDGNHNNPVYAAMIEALDDAVGKVLAALKEHGLEQNTLVMVVSDNGGIRAISKQTPLRAGKGSLYEGGVRVPMAVRWPGKIPGGTVSKLRLSNLDFFPTLLEWCGGSAADVELDGKDLSRQMCRPSSEVDPDRAFLWHFPAYLEAYKPGIDDGRDPLFRTRPCTSLLKGPWKLLHFYEDDAVELYNLGDDPGERTNLADQYPDRVADMLREKNALLGTHHLPVPTELNPDYDEAADRALRADVPPPGIPDSSKEEEWYRVMSFID